jgi:hypothetical protein
MRGVPCRSDVASAERYGPQSVPCDGELRFGASCGKVGAMRLRDLVGSEVHRAHIVQRQCARVSNCDACCCAVAAHGECDFVALLEEYPKIDPCVGKTGLELKNMSDVP